MNRALPLAGLLKLLYGKRAAIQHAVFRVVLPAVLAVKPHRFWGLKVHLGSGCSVLKRSFAKLNKSMFQHAGFPQDREVSRSAAIRSASAFILPRCSSESCCRASSRLMTSKNAAVCNPCL